MTDAADRERDQLIAKLSGDLAALHDQKGLELGVVSEERDALRAERDQLTVALEWERVRGAWLDRERAQLLARVAELQAKVDEIYASETFRIGSIIMWVPYRIRNWRANRHAVRAAGGRRRWTWRRAAVPEHELTEDAGTRSRYEAALRRREFTTDGVHVAVAVYTTDLDEGRGDVYTAVGLGLQLEPLGYELVYLPKESWYDVPEQTDVYLSLIAEPEHQVDPTHLPSHCTLVGWVRNNTARWAAQPGLALYHALLCSSEETTAALRRVYDGPLGILRIGVDHELFQPGSPEAERHGVVSTVNEWGSGRRLLTVLAERRPAFALALYGTHRQLHPSLRRHARGPASFFALPSLYRQTSVVLDDQQVVNQPFGNVNSRVFESLACGALPITNAPLGLAATGLDAVPVWTGVDDLHGQVGGFVADDDARARLVEQLRAEVLANHTYQHRAAELDDFLTAHDLKGRRTVGERTLLGFYPDYRETNPYQRMLYAAARGRGIVTVPTGEPDELLLSPVARGEPFVFHLHWTSPATTTAGERPRTRTEAASNARRFLARIDAIRSQGARVIWTVHNVVPHECPFPDVEHELRRELSRRADVVHVMCDETVAIVEPLYPLPADRVRTVEHPSYVDVYPNVVSHARARAELGLRPDELVLLFLGQVRPYKGLEDLLDAYRTLRRRDPAIRLVIAGAAGRFPGDDDLLARCGSEPGVVTRFGTVADDRLQVYFNATDVVVLPYRKVLNSGAALLALSFGRPVIGPAAGCLTPLITPDVGLTFDPDLGIGQVLSRARELDTPEHRRAAFELALRLDHRAISERFATLVTELTTAAAPEPARRTADEPVAASPA